MMVREGLVAAVLLLSPLIKAGTSDHRYQVNEHVELWVNKVGPYANPQEAYEYYTLPYCAPETKHHPEEKSDTGGGRFNEWKQHSIGEVLGGHALRHSGHDITFDTKAEEKIESCTTGKLTKEQVEKFQLAVHDRWFYQMYLDDLPVWGMVGELLPDADKLGDIQDKDDRDRLDAILSDPNIDVDSANLKPYVYTSRTLVISYRGDQIIKVDLTSEPKSLVELKDGIELEFILKIQWERTSEEFHSRFDRYLDHDFFKHPIHWFSIFNSFMMVLFLMGLVALILLRTLKKDYARYGIVYDVDDGGESGTAGVDKDDDGKPLNPDSKLGGSATEDAGWKQVHGDVFRAPHYLTVFAALVGNGWQLVTLTLGVVVFAVLGPLHGEVHEERGEMWSAILVCYSLSSIVSGYMSGKFFKLYYPTTAGARRLNTKAGDGASAGAGGSFASGSSEWQAAMGLNVILLPTITAITLIILNSISLMYGTISSVPFLVTVKLVFIWIFISVPLCVMGTLLGRHAKFGTLLQGGGKAGPAAAAGFEHFPCRVNAIPRPIPEDVPWYGKPQGLIPLAGLLSFGSIFIELYYVLTSLWNYKFYHVYGFLLGVYAIMTIVVGMTSIIVVYFLLNAENYYWQWTAFGSGASISLYVFLYGIYYFLFKTQMNGFLQTSFYFGYMSLIAMVLGILCGTLGHGAASRFVRAIFQNVKVD